MFIFRKGLVEKYNNTSRSLLRLQYNNTSRSLLCLQYNTSRSLLCLQYNNTSHSPVCIHPKLFSTNSRLCSKDEEKKEQGNKSNMYFSSFYPFIQSFHLLLGVQRRDYRLKRSTVPNLSYWHFLNFSDSG